MRAASWGVLLALLLPLFTAAHAADAVTNVIVGFHDAPPTEASYEGGRVLLRDATLRFLVVATSDPARFLSSSAQDPRVRYAEVDGVVSASFSPNDPAFASGAQYAPVNVGAPAAWDATLGSTGVSLCIVDSGVRLSHEDIALDRYLGGFDLIERDDTPEDEFGHGTFTTALATARTDNGLGIAGMAAVSWRHARVLDANGLGSTSNTALGIAWCADQGAHIISLSLGRVSESVALRDAVDRAWALGALVVAASGNGACGDCVQTPARLPRVLAVACTDANDAPCFLSSVGPELDLVAPGALIVGPWADGDASYVTRSGTSASTPIVAGALALLKSAYPTFTNAQLRARIESTARDLAAPGWDATTGFGLVRIDDAITAGASSATIECLPAPATMGRPATCAFGVGTGAPSVVLDVDWGDGTTSRVPSTGALAAGASTDAAHTWNTAGPFELRVTTRDATTLAPMGIVTRAQQLVRDCTYERAGALTVGLGGVAAESVSARTHGAVPPGCAGSGWSVDATSELPFQWQVCWTSGPATLLCEFADRGFVPPGATSARLTLQTGVDVRYTLRVPS